MTELIRDFATRVGEVLKAVVGVPDYRRYLVHMREAHPGDRVMTETEFNMSRMKDRYDRVGSRCC